MATQVSSFGNDVHLYPLYLKCAAENFSKGKTSEGMEFFRAACDNPRIFEHKVYKQMWKLRGPEGDKGDPEYGRKSFHSLSCSSLKKAQAIEMALRKVDRHELDMRENQVHKCLWIIHGSRDGDLEYGRHAFYNIHGRFSNIQDKLWAIRIYSSESRVLTWLTNREEVRLIKRADGGLEYLVIDRNSRKSWISPLDRHGQPTETVISSLSKCDVIVNGGAVNPYRPAICEELPEPIFPAANQELRLLWKGDRLIWRLFDNTTKKVSWIFARNDEVIRNLSAISETERRSYLKDFNIKIKDFNVKTSEKRLMDVSFDKIRKQCVLDPNQTIDRDNWAITLISAGSSSEFYGYAEPYFGHAQIIYEKIKEGIHIVGVAHLTTHGAPSGHARVQKIDINSEPSYRKKSPTWVRERVFVERMLNRIEEEKDRWFLFNHSGNDWLSVNTYKNIVDGFIEGCRIGQETSSLEEKRRRFNEFIERLRSNQDYNCLTWTLERIKLAGILPPLPFFNNVAAVPDVYVNWIIANPSLVRFS